MRSSPSNVTAQNSDSDLSDDIGLNRNTDLCAHTNPGCNTNPSDEMISIEKTTILRETGETSVRISLAPFATPSAVPAASPSRPPIATGEPFLDHMLITLARYAGAVLEVEATGDLRHHLIEDVAITIGLALRDTIPETCVRYAECTIPMDDALVQVVLDLGGRSWYEGPLPSPLYDHFFRSLAENARITLHLRVLRGRDRHHIVEAAFKALGLALARALAPGEAVFSTKGAVRIERGGA